MDEWIQNEAGYGVIRLAVRRSMHAMRGNELLLPQTQDIPCLELGHRGRGKEEKSREDVCSQTPHANKMNPKCSEDTLPKGARPFVSRAISPISEHGAGTSTGGPEKWHEPKTGCVSGSHRKACPLGTWLQLQNGQSANSKQWLPVNPKALRATPPSSRNPPPSSLTSSAFLFYQTPTSLVMVLSLDSHFICSMQKYTHVTEEWWQRTRCLN